MEDRGFTISVDYQNRQFAAVLWGSGDILASVTYAHDHRLEWFDDRCVDACKRQIQDSIRAWNSGFGEIRGAVIDNGLGQSKAISARRAAANWKEFRIKWHTKMRDGLIDAVKPYCDVVMIRREDQYYAFSGELITAYKEILGSDKRRQILRRAIMCGVQAGYYQQPLAKTLEEIQRGPNDALLRELSAINNLDRRSPDQIRKALGLISDIILFSKDDLGVRKMNSIADKLMKEFDIDKRDQTVEIDAIKKRLKTAGIK